MPNHANVLLDTYRFSRRITSQLQNWAFLTYLHGKPRNTYIYLMQERQNVSNISRHQEIVVLSLNLPYYSNFSCHETLNACCEKLWFLQLWRYSSGEVIYRPFNQKKKEFLATFFLNICTFKWGHFCEITVIK